MPMETFLSYFLFPADYFFTNSGFFFFEEMQCSGIGNKFEPLIYQQSSLGNVSRHQQIHTAVTRTKLLHYGWL